MKVQGTLVLLITAFALGDMTSRAERHADEGSAPQDWMQSLTPGEPHKKLAAQAGEFVVSGRTWTAPGSKPMELKGTATQKMIHGGRYQVQEFKGQTMGMAYEGTAVTGYDNVTKEYFSTWIDTMRTGIVHYRGKADAQGVVSMTCEMEDPRDPSVKNTYRRVLKVNDPDTLVIETWMKDPKRSEEFKVAEMTLTRKK